MTFGEARPIGCLVTIGTGIPPDINLEVPNILGAIDFVTNGLAAIATSCERTHNTIQPIIGALSLRGEHKYCRFNVREKVTERGWLGPVDPSLLDKVTGWLSTWRGNKSAPEEVFRNWEDWVIAMDAYSKMELFEKVTAKYMEGEQEKI